MQMLKSKFKYVAMVLGFAAAVLLQGCGGSGAGAIVLALLVRLVLVQALVRRPVEQRLQLPKCKY